MLNSEIDRMPFRMPNILDAIGLSIWHPDCYWPNHKPMVFRMLQLMLAHINETPRVAERCMPLKLVVFRLTISTKLDFGSLIRGFFTRVKLKFSIRA